MGSRHELSSPQVAPRPRLVCRTTPMAAAPVKKAPTALCAAKAQRLTSELECQSAVFLHPVRPRPAGLIPLFLSCMSCLQLAHTAM